MYTNVVMKSLRITLLSLAGGTYKFLQDTGAFDRSSELLEDGFVKGFGGTIGGATSDILQEMCAKDEKSIYPIAALGTAVGLWFFFDSIIDYDENGGIEFHVPVLLDRYVHA